MGEPVVNALILAAIIAFAAVLVLAASGTPGAPTTLQDVREALASGELPVLPLAVMLTIALPRFLDYVVPGISETWVGYGFAFGVSFTAAGIYRERTEQSTGCLYLIMGVGMLVISLFFLIPYFILGAGA